MNHQDVQNLSNAGNSAVCNSAVTNINTIKNTANTSKKYKTFVECILCEFDPIYSVLKI